jgi:hypothetical protein
VDRAHGLVDRLLGGSLWSMVDHGQGGGRGSPESSPHGTTGPQNLPWWHENGEGVAAVLTNGSNNWSRGGDELAIVMK